MRVSAIYSNPASEHSGLKAALLENRASILRFLAARRVPTEEAEDLFQDLFIKLESVSPGVVADPRAYLCRMADNLLLDRRRSSGRRADREEAWMESEFGTESGADERPSIEQVLIARERLAAVSSALARLPDRTLEIFRKFRVDGISQRQIAAELGISVSAVEKHLQKAYQAVVAIQSQLDADMSPSHRPSVERTT